MSNILDTVQYIPCNSQNYGSSRSTSKIKYLIYHYTGNDGDHDTGNANYYKNNVVKASAHYFVDDDSVTQSVKDNIVAWSVGGKKWSDCSSTGGGTMHGIITNTNSLSIEMCDTSKDGTLMATDATLSRAIELGRALMNKYGITIDRVYRHFDVTGKHCPAYFMDNTVWNTFKNRLITQEEEIVTQEQFNEMMDAYLVQRAQIPASDWSATERAKVESAGIIKGGSGTGYKSFVTREELAVVEARALKL